MVKLDITALLYSKKNYELSYNLKKWCRDLKINLVTILDFVELAIKTMQLRPQIIFCDCNTVEFSSGNIRSLLERKDYNSAQIVFVGENENCLNYIKQFINDKFVYLNPCDVPVYLDKMENELRMKANTNAFDREVEKDLGFDVCRMLCKLGLSQRHSGYAFVKDIIINVVLNNGVVHSLISDQYPFIAAKFKTSVVNVERNIRNAIDSAWKLYGQTKWSEQFFSKSVEVGKRPTNREFIFMCVDKLMNEMQQAKLNFKVS